MAFSCGRRPEPSTQIKAPSSPLVTLWLGCRPRVSRSAGLGESAGYDNILVEMLWRIPKYEEVYPRAYSDDWEASIDLTRFLWRYCYIRPLSAFGSRASHAAYTEAEICFSRP